MGGLTGKTAVIICGGTGYGAGIARAMANAGARVLVTDVNAETAEAMAVETGGLWAEVDPWQNSSVGAMAYKAADLLGDIDMLVNASVFLPAIKPLDQWAEAEFDAGLLAQIKPIYLSARHFVPAMKARRSGAILTVLGPAKSGSVWADAARGAAISATKAMALELAADGIRVNALSMLADASPALPSFLGGKKNDDRVRKLGAIPLGRFSLPDDLGQAAAFLCSDAASLITGVVLEVDGGAGL